LAGTALLAVLAVSAVSASVAVYVAASDTASVTTTVSDAVSAGLFPPEQAASAAAIKRLMARAVNLIRFFFIGNLL
jgi:hypothetical protein